MSFQRILLVKRFVTKLAFKWLIGCMDTLVSIESGSKSESFSTNVTPERSGASVTVNMSLKVSFLVKPFTTVLTLVQSHIRVCSHVVLKMGQLFEAPAALDALVRLFPRVRVAMYLHVHLLMESLSAIVADERLVIGVCSQVSVQVGHAAERLVALGTRVRLVSSVSLFMTS